MINVDGFKKCVSETNFEGTKCMSCGDKFKKSEEPKEIYFSDQSQLILICQECYNEFLDIIIGLCDLDNKIEERTKYLKNITPAKTEGMEE